MNPLPSGQQPARAAVALPPWLAEFALIRRPAAMFAAVLILGTAALLASRARLAASEELLQQAQRARAAAYERYSQVGDEQRDLRDYQAPYAMLQSRGLIGAEARLEWIETIRQIREQRQLLPLTYEIAPQQPFRLDGAPTMGDYQLRGSRMALHMDLLHEGDLFNFLDDLKSRHFVAVQDCALKRAAPSQGTLVAPTLSANCTLHWITLGKGPGPGVQP